MSELSDISAAGNRKLVAAQVHWSERPGTGSVAAFSADVDHIAVEINAKFDNLNKRDGTSVTSAKSAFATLAAAAKTAATNAGKVEPPTAA